MNRQEKLKLLKLFICFFKIGLFTFGGGFAMIPLMEKELVNKHHWVKKRDFVNSIALTQSVPGAIAFNLAVYFGHDVMGIIGSLVCVVAVALPSVLIILGIAVFFSTFSEMEIVQNIFKGIRPAVVALIIYAAINIGTHLKWDAALFLIVIAATSVSIVFSFNPVLLILVSFVIGTGKYLYDKAKKKKSNCDSCKK
ncbi:MAG TPA: chromate transporter [Thermotogota bacterium]|nr:chromate transporter [Thermotogota bacterium]HRW34530.1 chromate transporter [Thermotogota bacterium]